MYRKNGFGLLQYFDTKFILFYEVFRVSHFRTFFTGYEIFMKI